MKKEKTKKNKIPKEISQEILKKIFYNLLRAIGVMVYFVILNLAYVNIKQEKLVGDIEVFAGAFLVAGIYMMEKAYKRDSGEKAITAIELLVLALHSLSIMHIITFYKYDFRFYLLTSSYVFSIYYVFKSIVMYTKGRKEYLNSLSDISEIVKKEEPIKKEAKKRNKEEMEEKVAEEIAIKTEEKIEEKGKKKTEKVKETEKAEKKEVKPKSIRRLKKKQLEEIEEKSKKTAKSKKEQAEDKPKKATKSKKEQIDEEIEAKESNSKKKRGRPKKEVKVND